MERLYIKLINEQLDELEFLVLLDCLPPIGSIIQIHENGDKNFLKRVKVSDRVPKFIYNTDTNNCDIEIYVMPY